MDNLLHLIGREGSLHEVTRAIRNEVEALHAPVVGAMHLTCSDESERECLDAFQVGLVKDLLPSLKFARSSAFRTATLGARYEWGGVRIAEEHFAIEAARNRVKVMVVKVNAHVALDTDGHTLRFGQQLRYRKPSAYCGALHALLNGQRGFPALLDLEEAFLSEGLDRLTILNDPAQVEPDLRALYAAVASARLQARRVMLDIQGYTPASPTVFLIHPCVTLNRAREDTELLCGTYRADYSSDDVSYVYAGLGDDPAAYTMNQSHGVIHITDAGREQIRAARDHRAMVGRQLQRHPPGAYAHDPRLKDLAGRASTVAAQGPGGKLMLKSLLLLLGEIAPGPAAVLLFAEGIAEMYHVYRAHRLAADHAAAADAKHILSDVQNRIDGMSDEEADRTVQLLLDHFGG
jgi:hypothetical protein